MGFIHLQIEWNPWLGGYCPQIPVLSDLCLQLNLLNPSPKKFLGTPLSPAAGVRLFCSWLYLSSLPRGCWPWTSLHEKRERWWLWLPTTPPFPADVAQYTISQIHHYTVRDAPWSRPKVLARKTGEPSADSRQPTAMPLCCTVLHICSIVVDRAACCNSDRYLKCMSCKGWELSAWSC
jgi:hypothetical protein